MEDYSELYWESSWKSESAEELYQYLNGYNKLKNPVIDLFRQYGVKKVCDAACGFGGYMLAFASNGFEVQGFDISKTAVETARKGLEKFQIDVSGIKVASILATGYANVSFDGVIANSVLDHLKAEDAKKALNELFRITKEGGLVMFSLDAIEDEDLEAEHIVLEDGSFLYTGEDGRKNMIFHHYDREKTRALIKGRTVIYEGISRRNQQIIVLQK